MTSPGSAGSISPDSQIAFRERMEGRGLLSGTTDEVVEKLTRLGELGLEEVYLHNDSYKQHRAENRPTGSPPRIASARGTPEQRDGSVVRFKGHERRSCGRLGDEAADRGVGMSLQSDSYEPLSLALVVP